MAEKGRSLCSIVVNHGAFGSAAEASAASEGVDWFGSDSAGASICTESFAAMELRHYLCALTGLDPVDPANFPIRSDREEVAGTVLIVGNDVSNRQCRPYLTTLGIRRDGVVAPGPEGFCLKTVRKADGVAVLLAGFDRVGTLYAVYDFLSLCGVRWFSPGLSGEVVPRRGVLPPPGRRPHGGSEIHHPGILGRVFHFRTYLCRSARRQGKPGIFSIGWPAIV